MTLAKQKAKGLKVFKVNMLNMSIMNFRVYLGLIMKYSISLFNVLDYKYYKFHQKYDVTVIIFWGIVLYIYFSKIGQGQAKVRVRVGIIYYCYYFIF